MASLKESLDKSMDIDGAVGVAVADYSSGMCLGTAGGHAGFDLEVAAAGNSEVVRSKHGVMKELKLDDQIEDILITLGREYHLLFPLPSTSLFVYMVLDRKKANLALARHKLREICSTLDI